MIWADDFAQAAGTSPNPAVYSALLADGSQQLGLPTFGTGEVEHNFPDAAYQDGNGNLNIHTALGNGVWSSARIWTAQLQTFQYGKLEIRAKFPTGNFNWPAIWMLGANYAPPNRTFGTTSWPESGEIDIAEGLGGNSVDQATLHGLDTGCNCAWNGGGGVTAVAPLQNISAGYHVWGMQWQPNQVQFTMDGAVFVTDSFDGTIVTQTFANGSKSYYNSRGVWPFNQPFFLILNNAVPAGSRATNGASSDFLIDYVHYSKFNGYGQLGH
jgi:beta-glucanase (GH16 family)